MTDDLRNRLDHLARRADEIARPDALDRLDRARHRRNRSRKVGALVVAMLIAIGGTATALIAFDGDDEALTVANDSHLGLQAAVYTSSLKRAFRYLDNLRVGNVVVNDSTDYWEAHEPFGGASGTRTGWGRIGGRYTMLDMTDLKTVVLDVGGLE
jgi:hypothetical protein